MIKIHVSIIFTRPIRHVYNISNVQCGFLLDRQTTATNDVGIYHPSQSRPVSSIPWHDKNPIARQYQYMLNILHSYFCPLCYRALISPTLCSVIWIINFKKHFIMVKCEHLETIALFLSLKLELTLPLHDVFFLLSLLITANTKLSEEGGKIGGPRNEQM